MQSYDKDNIPTKVVNAIRKEFVPDENFTPTNIAKASSAAEGLCKWVLAMEGYDRVAKVSNFDSVLCQAGSWLF